MSEYRLDALNQEDTMPELQTSERENLPARRVEEWSRERIDLLKRTICKGADDLELELFLAICKRTGLDPFARQAHFVKRWDSRERREVGQAQIGIDGLRLIADRTGRYVPGREPRIEVDSQGRPICATAYVKKLVGGEWHEIASTAYYAEFVQVDRNGAPTALWAKMPRVMLAKVAESQALRKAFPAELSGIYSPEEMDQADNPVPSLPAAPSVSAVVDAPQREPEPSDAAGRRAKKLEAIAQQIADLAEWGEPALVPPDSATLSEINACGRANHDRLEELRSIYGDPQAYQAHRLRLEEEGLQQEDAEPEE